MRHFEEEGSATPPTVDIFLENWVEHSDAGIVESILSLLSQRTRKGVLQATANNLRERRLQYKQWENEATKERKKKRQLQLWQAFQNGREKHPTGSLPAAYRPDNRNTLREREALLHLQQQWDKVTPEARERMLQHIVAQIPLHMLQELAIHIATAHSLVGENSPPTALTNIRLHLRRPNEEEEEDREGPSRQRATATAAATTMEGDKKRNEQEERGKEERAKENLTPRYETMGKHGQRAVQSTQIDIVEEEDSQQPTQLVGEARLRRYEAAKKKGTEEVQKEQEVERMLEEEKQIQEETRRGEDRLTKEEQDQIAQHIQEEEEQEDTDMQHLSTTTTWKMSLTKIQGARAGNYKKMAGESVKRGKKRKRKGKKKGSLESQTKEKTRKKPRKKTKSRKSTTKKVKKEEKALGNSDMGEGATTIRELHTNKRN